MDGRKKVFGYGFDWEGCVRWCLERCGQILRKCLWVGWRWIDIVGIGLVAHVSCLADDSIQQQSVVNK